ncbi:disease resistance-like protein CSA1 isoform X2 [Prunus yedoensis var. nudiflora]|uniref:Disease resistance-like protein CSA1 isoform X2 n=1 Tax=Prunus yedoensis var. nudiflora TaxID=2094558 RepID=A0A314UGY5_PRUYE|nr:disease resistance-like protein CSA1 isoform X2 [Prunus yedoensis var. nudiflora]
MTKRCKYNFKTSNGESHEVNHPLFISLDNAESHEVFVWWYNNVFEEVVEGAQSPTAFYKRVTEVNVDFTVWDVDYGSSEEEQELEVEKCGICLLYGKDAEMIKQRALYAQDF